MKKRILLLLLLISVLFTDTTIAGDGFRGIIKRIGENHYLLPTSALRGLMSYPLISPSQYSELQNDANWEMALKVHTAQKLLDELDDPAAANLIHERLITAEIPAVITQGLRGGAEDILEDARNSGHYTAEMVQKVERIVPSKSSPSNGMNSAEIRVRLQALFDDAAYLNYSEMELLPLAARPTEETARIIGHQKTLTPALQGALFEAKKGPRDEASRAANLLHTEAGSLNNKSSVANRPPEPQIVQPDLWKTIYRLIDYTVFSDIWSPFPPVLIEQIATLIESKLDPRELNDWHAFLQRFSRYSRNGPRRLVKLIWSYNDVLHDPPPWKTMLMEPEMQLNKDLRLRRKILSALRREVPQWVLELGNGIRGILVIGGFASLPTDGSDLDIVLVHDANAPAAIAHLRLDQLEAKRELERRIGYKYVSIANQVRHGSLNFRREQELGSIYIGL